MFEKRAGLSAGYVVFRSEAPLGAGDRASNYQPIATILNSKENDHGDRTNPVSFLFGPPASSYFPKGGFGSKTRWTKFIQLLKGNRAQGNLQSHDVCLNNFPILAVQFLLIRRGMPRLYVSIHFGDQVRRELVSAVHANICQRLMQQTSGNAATMHRLNTRIKCSANQRPSPSL